MLSFLSPSIITATRNNWRRVSEENGNGSEGTAEGECGGIPPRPSVPPERSIAVIFVPSVTLRALAGRQKRFGFRQINAQKNKIKVGKFNNVTTKIGVLNNKFAEFKL